MRALALASKRWPLGFKASGGYNMLWYISEVFLGEQRVDQGPETAPADIRQHPPASRPESYIAGALENRL